MNPIQNLFETLFGVFPLTQKNQEATPLAFLVGIFKFGLSVYCYKNLEIPICLSPYSKEPHKEKPNQETGVVLGREKTRFAHRSTQK